MNDLTTKFDISTIEDQDLDFIQQQIMNRKLKSMMERIEQVETSRIRDKEELNIRQIGLENDIKDLKDDNEKKVLRASSINGLNRSDLALPILEGVKAQNYSSQKLFFEMAYAYNALKNYSKAEIIINVFLVPKSLITVINHPILII